ncbi:unnamed protein product [Allacma fusca]|uniref:Tetraspanin n=1 Tax=Allacma fusca TaxID=39272 RepID=A0A8J2JQ20_9HEXA|nr:unnamed protein product [Allacma fusca]
MDLGTCVVKYCLCLFNFIFVVVGGAILGLGVWLAADQSSILTLLKLADQETLKYYCSSLLTWKISEEYGSATVIEQLGYFFIALGAFIFIISFLGYCGTMKESRVLLGMYSFFLVLIFVLEIVVVVLFFVYKPDMERETRGVLTTSVHKYYSTRERANAFTLTLDFTMAQSRCCGISNSTDFVKAEMFQRNKTAGQMIPVACCKLGDHPLELKPEDPTCTINPTIKNSYFKRGCLDSFFDTLYSSMNYAIIVGLVVALLQVVGIVFAICVYKAAYYDYK